MLYRSGEILRTRTALGVLLGLLAVGGGFADEIDASLAAPGIFRRDYTYYPEAGGWLKYHRKPLSWYKAREACYHEGARLASPINFGVSIAMMVMLKSIQSRYVYTGIRTMSTKDDYFSIEGVHITEMLNTNAWAEGEPDDFNNFEQCIVMTPSGELADTKCDLPYPFLCYKAKTSDMVVNECGNYDNAYIKNNGTGSCYKFHMKMITWYEALSVCTTEGGHLAVINSEEELQVLQSEGASDYMIGIYNWAKDPNSIDHWTTIDGQTLKEAGFWRWKDGEPRNDWRCGRIYLKNRTLLTFPCKENTNWFICEIELPKTT